MSRAAVRIVVLVLLFAAIRAVGVASADGVWTALDTADLLLSCVLGVLLGMWVAE